MRVARRFIVRGRVQGVGFRWFIQELAALEGAAGWVKNLPDGGVEALVQAEADAVLRIDRQIRRGPSSARIERVDVMDEPASDRLHAFVIE
jgi:acylphosphatase